ncbi:MAG: hypothetical protein Q4E17_03065 [Synergistes sp.]|nr:hypothetical protein [Synergistes sp.]
MGALTNLHKRFSCTLTVAVIYLVVHLFILFSVEGPSFSNLQDTCSIHIMETVKSISLAALTEKNSSVRLSVANASSLSFTPIAAACSAAEVLRGRAVIFPFTLWQTIIGREREAIPFPNMVERK